MLTLSNYKSPRFIYLSICCSLLNEGLSKSEAKGKSRPITGQKGLEGEYRYNSTLSLNSVLDVGGWPTLGPAALPPKKKNPCTHYRGVWLGPGPVWTGAENLEAYKYGNQNSTCY